MAAISQQDQKRLNDMNARDQAIKAGVKNFIERPYIYNIQVSVPGSGTIYNMGVPSTPYVLNITPSPFSWIKTMFVTSSGTRLVRANIVRSEDTKPTTATATGHAQTTIGYADGYVPLRHIAGSGMLPYIKKPAEYCEFNATRTITLADESGAASPYTAYLAISGTQYVNANGAFTLIGPWRNILNVGQSTNRVTVAGLGTSVVNYKMQNGDFVCTELMIDAQAACLINIVYNDIPVTNGYIHSSNINGEPNINGVIPNILTAQMEVMNTGNIEIDINDLSGSSNNVDITMGGFLLLK